MNSPTWADTLRVNAREEWLIQAVCEGSKTAPCKVGHRWIEHRAALAEVGR